MVCSHADKLCPTHLDLVMIATPGAATIKKMPNENAAHIMKVISYNFADNNLLTQALTAANRSTEPSPSKATGGWQGLGSQ